MVDKNNENYVITLLDNISELVYIIDPKNYQILYANKTASEMYGEELIGKTCYEVMHKEPAPCNMCENPSLILNKGELYRFETYYENFDRYYIKEAKMIDWPGHGTVRMEIAIDITEMKKAQKYLEERIRYEAELANVSRQLLKEDMDRALQESLHHLQKASNADRVYIFRNFKKRDPKTKSRKTYTEYAYEVCKEGIEPQIDVEVLKHFDYDYGFMRWKKQLSKGIYIAGHVEDFPPEEREVLWMQGVRSILIIPIFVEKKWYGFLGFDEVGRKREWEEQDVAIINTAADMLGTYIEKKQREEDLKNNQKKLRVAMKKAQESNRQKSEFIANMSHEIRTPMNAIIGFADMLEKEIHAPKQLEYLNYIKRGGENLLTLINDILDLSKIDAGMMKIELKEVSLRQMFEEIIGIFSLRAKERNIKLQSEVDESIPEVLFLDEIRIRQILVNLVGNAIKFTDRGFVKIRASFKMREKGYGDLSLEVIDSGKGISQKGQREVFKPFVQWGRLESNQPGTGLGLSITKNLVEVLEGELHLYSVPKKGSRFEIIFHHIKVRNGSEAAFKAISSQRRSETGLPEFYEIKRERVKALEFFEKEGKWGYRRVKDSGFFDEIRSFGELLKEKGETHGITGLRDYGVELVQTTDQFDIEGIKRLLRHYPSLIQRIKEQANDG